MKSICVHSRIATSATAIVLLLNVPPALAADQSENAGPNDRGAADMSSPGLSGDERLRSQGRQGE